MDSDSLKRLHTRTLQIFIATWNAGNAAPENLENLFPVKGSNDIDYDIYVIGLQESTYSLTSNSAPSDTIDSITSPKYRSTKQISNFYTNNNPNGNVANASSSSSNNNINKVDDNSIKHMQSKIMGILGDEFEIVIHNRRAQLQLYVIANKVLKPYISNIEINAENTGFLNIFPNKGGLLATMNIDNTSLAFVSCHLAAHEGVTKCQLRNDSIKEILKGARVRNKNLDILAQFHHVFWMGDMNYRLTFDKATPSDGQLSTNRPLTIKSPTNSTAVNITPDYKTTSINLTTELSNRSNSIHSDDNNIQGSKYHKLSLNTDLMDDFHDDDHDHEHDDDMVTPAVSTKSNNRVIELNNIYKLIAEEKWSELLKLDELNRELASGRVLEGFTALQPCFPPTFKRKRHEVIKRLDTSIDLDPFHSVDIHTQSTKTDGNKQWSIYYGDSNMPRFSLKDKDRRESIAILNSQTKEFNDNIVVSTHSSDSSISLGSSVTDLVQQFYDKKRIPSYTDRILYKSWHGFVKNLECKQFGSKEYVTSSDHKPVYAVFQLTTTGGINEIRQFFENKMIPRYPMTATTHPSIFSTETHIIKSHSSEAIEDNRRTNRPSSANINKPGSNNIGRPGSMNSFPSVSKTPEKIKIILTNLVGHNLAEMDSALSGGKSDPYLVITTDPKEILKSSTVNNISAFNCFNLYPNKELKYSCRSSTIYHNINPKWSDEIKLTLLSSDILNLKENLHFIITVWDEDRYNNDDVIGSFTVSFADMLVCFNENKPYEFRHKILNSGIQMGVISGKFILKGDVNEILVRNDISIQSQLMSNINNTISNDNADENDGINKCTVV